MDAPFALYQIRLMAACKIHPSEEDSVFILPQLLDNTLGFSVRVLYCPFSFLYVFCRLPA